MAGIVGTLAAAVIAFAVLAAGGCDLLTGGRGYHLVEPRVYTDEAQHDIPAPVRLVLRRLGATSFMALRPLQP